MVTDTLALAKNTQAALNALVPEGRSLEEEWKQAAEAGDSEAQFKLGQIHYDRRSHVQDRGGKYVKARNLDEELRLAFKWFIRAADQGHAQAQCEVASCYLSGWGVDKDTAKGEDYLRLASENGCAKASKTLAYRLIHGTQDTKSSRQKSVDYMRKAAETGDGWAAVWLSRLYSSGRVRQYVEHGGGYVEGIEVTPDAGESLRWLRVAAYIGFVKAQVLLAERYLDGDGVVQDFGQAEKWLHRAAENKDAEALFMLGQLYEEGIEVSEDISKAVMWYRKAAEESHYDEFGAARSLARCYTQGRGVSKDLAEAYLWLKFGAEAAGDEDAKVELASLCRQMSQSELTEGQNRYEQLQQLRKMQFGES